MKFVICTYARTGSTLLSNIIAGLFYPKEPIGFIDYPELNIKDFYDSDFNVIKSHLVDRLVREEESEDLFFITSHRLDVKHRLNYPNHWVVFDYQNFLIDEDLKQSVNFVANKLKDLSGIKLSQLNIKNCIGRLELMNNRVNELKKHAFETYDPFFHIHGGHRNRKS